MDEDNDEVAETTPTDVIQEETETPPNIPKFFIGDIVAVTEFRRETVGTKFGLNVRGGIARVTKVHETTCDLNFYVEGRRVKAVPFDYVIQAPATFDASTNSENAVVNDEEFQMLSGSWEAQALRQAETLARAGSKRERKQIVPFESYELEPSNRRQKQSQKQSNNNSSNNVHGKRQKNKTNNIENDGEVNEAVAALPKMARNSKAFKQGKWRKEPFDNREYERLNEYVMAKHCNVGKEEVKANALATSLNDFQLITQAYNDEAIVERYIRQEIMDFDWSSNDMEIVNGTEKRKHKLMKDTDTLSLLFKTELDKNNNENPTSTDGKTTANTSSPKKKLSTIEKRQEMEKQRHEEEWALRDAVEDSLIRSLIASRLDGMIQEVFSRAVGESGALAQPPLTLTTSSIKMSDGGELVDNNNSIETSFKKENVEVTKQIMGDKFLNPREVQKEDDMEVDGSENDVFNSEGTAAVTPIPAGGSVSHGYLREQPVWGIDAYTRHHIRLTLEDSKPFLNILRKHRFNGSIFKKVDSMSDNMDILSTSSSSSSSSSSTSTSSSSSSTGGVESGIGIKGLVIKAFESKVSGNLSVNLGDEVLIKDKTSSDRGWLVLHLNSGVEGWIPPSCIDTTEDVLITNFIERCLLPTINQSPNKACFITALNNIVEANSVHLDSTPGGGGGGGSVGTGDDHINACPSEIALGGATALLKSIEMRGGMVRSGVDFRIHPKGTGVVVNNEAGVRPHTFVNEYIGELYPPYRWFERQDATALAQKLLKMPPTLPDFYNIVLERPSYDEKGYGLWYVDASKRANFSSSLSHSCSPNCEPRMAVRNGRLCIVLVTLRACSYGEELTFDYGAVTGSADEYSLAICLCGTSLCRQSFLDYVASENTQQLLMRWHSPTDRFALLFDASISNFRSKATKKASDELIRLHGLVLSNGQEDVGDNDGDRRKPEEKENKSIVLTSVSNDVKERVREVTDDTAPFWLRRFIAKTLSDFIDKERVYLPLQLRLDGVSCQNANMEGRSVIEQRMQAMVGAISCVQHVLKKQKKVKKRSKEEEEEEAPLKVIGEDNLIKLIWFDKAKSLMKYLLDAIVKEEKTYEFTSSSSSLANPNLNPKGISQKCSSGSSDGNGRNKNNLNVKSQNKSYFYIAEKLKKMLGVPTLIEIQLLKNERKNKKQIKKTLIMSPLNTSSSSADSINDAETQSPQNTCTNSESSPSPSVPSSSSSSSPTSKSETSVMTSSIIKPVSASLVKNEEENDDEKMKTSELGLEDGRRVKGTDHEEAETLVVTDMMSLNRALLRVRALLLEAAHHHSVPPTSRSKHLAAADALLLWAHTRTFAMPHTYEAVESETVEVLASDLGAPLLRSSLKNINQSAAINFKPYLPPPSTPPTPTPSSSTSLKPEDQIEILTTPYHDQFIRENNHFDLSQVPNHLPIQYRVVAKGEDSSRFKGVRKRKGQQKWQSYINHGGKSYSLGSHATEESAAAMYTMTFMAIKLKREEEAKMASPLKLTPLAEGGMVQSIALEPEPMLSLPLSSFPASTFTTSLPATSASSSTSSTSKSTSLSLHTSPLTSSSCRNNNPDAHSEEVDGNSNGKEDIFISQALGVDVEDDVKNSDEILRTESSRGVDIISTGLKVDSAEESLPKHSSSPKHDPLPLSNSTSGSTSVNGTLVQRDQLEETEQEVSEELVNKSEVVLRRRALYGPYFLIGRLLDWFNTEEGSGNLGTKNNSNNSTYFKKNTGMDSSSSTPNTPPLEVIAAVGEDIPTEVLFGCVMLPEPAQCYYAANYSSSSSSSSSSLSTSNKNKKLYNRKERLGLFHMLNDKTVRRQSWDSKLASFFGGGRASNSRARLLGSPVVDFLQGSYKGLDQILRTLGDELDVFDEGSDEDDEFEYNKRNKKKKTKSEKKKSFEQALVDESAVAENEQSWIQCDVCSKWRRVPWFVDSEVITDFVCNSSKIWDQNFTCADPEEDYDASSEKVTTIGCDKIVDFKVGMMLDTYCLVNKCWYEAKVIKVGLTDNEEEMKKKDLLCSLVEGEESMELEASADDTNEDSAVKSGASKVKRKKKGGHHLAKQSSDDHRGQVQIHFKGWGKSADEWINMNSDRISPYRMHTCGTSWRSEVSRGGKSSVSSISTKKSTTTAKRHRSKSAPVSTKRKRITSTSVKNSKKKLVALEPDVELN